MRREMPQKPVCVIAGPIASGKSSLALALAKTAPITIINADASQAYADLKLLSARPSDAEMEEAPHRLFGHIDGVQSYSAAQWAAEAQLEVDAAHAAGQIPVLVGGTGLYLRTLLYGIAPIPVIASGVRDAVRAMDLALAREELYKHDPASFDKFHAADSVRIRRALEVVLSSGKPIHYWQAQNHGGLASRIGLSAIVLLPPRDWLYPRCDARFEAMMADGAIEEVRALMERGLNPELPVMRAIGVRELADFILGKTTQEEAVLAGQLATRQYAKRQYTWFRNQPPGDWERVDTQLNYENINELVIKLRDMTLTS
jgi:tRNA dimethylallyltransferase